ncbi:DUF4907 domain-containing protein [Chitinophaga solisilvae]|uniref:DUF4907 domain-containing protein n=1 Tax=Chitinophaga solisilvae TaxID=1233460 RepID=A0A3S1DKV9_9BACT|nr:DUF4907 domain-containing protein [Chitinophaga solisilvae]NSL90432.1 DUF4907 domain-containing protein [Chitinophaga solisilvae]
MTKRKLLIRLTILLAALLLLIVRWQRKADSPRDASPQLAVETFPAHDGWGYKVLINGKPYIYQDIIPGMAGNRAFVSRTEALRAGHAVMEKIAQHKNPAITQEDLKKLQISGLQ